MKVPPGRDRLPLRVLALPRYGRLGASSRLRMWQFVPCLVGAGFEVTALPLLPDEYVEQLQAGRRSPSTLASAYARQVLKLLAREPFDLVWIEKEVLPWLPRWVDRLLLPARVPVVLDYDDAVYHAYEAHRHPLVRRLLKNKHAHAMRAAALVIAGNSHLAERARVAGAARVAIVPTVIDLDRYPAPAQRAAGTRIPRVCWVGQRSTAHYLAPLRQLFTEMEGAGQARFVAIGIDAEAHGLPMESVRWTEAGETATIAACDIGIMPLSDGPFEQGKCGYKLIQYMACGLPVVASPVGANREIVEHGVNGFLADTPQEWRNALSTLAADAHLRARMGAAGRRRVTERYSLQVTAPHVAELLRSAAAEHSGAAPPCF